jgi:hypothetical protein
MCIYLASGTEEQVRKRTSEILEDCAPEGHYVLGTGNSVVNYMPLSNYLAMLDEGSKWNEENWSLTPSKISEFPSKSSSMNREIFS